MFNRKGMSQTTAKMQLEFVKKKESDFRKKASSTDIRAFQNFYLMLQKNEQFTPGQLSYIEGLYEKTMAGLGFESVPLKHDLRRR